MFCCFLLSLFSCFSLLCFVVFYCIFYSSLFGRIYTLCVRLFSIYFLFLFAFCCLYSVISFYFCSVVLIVFSILFYTHIHSTSFWVQLFSILFSIPRCVQLFSTVFYFIYLSLCSADLHFVSHIALCVQLFSILFYTSFSLLICFLFLVVFSYSLLYL